MFCLRFTGDLLEEKKVTDNYSGILRLEDLARSIPDELCNLYLAAPNHREKEVIAQLARPTFRGDLAILSTGRNCGFRDSAFVIC